MVVNLLVDVVVVATLAEDLPYNAAMSLLSAIAKTTGALLGARPAA